MEIKIYASTSLFATNGTANGTFTVSNSYPIKVGSKGRVSSSAVAPIEIVVFDVDILTGTVTVKGLNNNWLDLSGFLTANSASLNIDDQSIRYDQTQVDLSKQTTPLLVHIAGAVPAPLGGATEATAAAILAGQTDGNQITQVSNFPSDYATSTQATIGNVALAAILARQADGSQKTQVTSTVLPTDAATQTTLAQVKTDLDNIYTRQADGNQRTQVTSSALPTGAATEASLITINTVLDTIHTRQADGSQKTEVTASALPTGAATNAVLTNGTQVTSVSNFPAGLALEGTLDNVLANQTNGTQKTQVTASALPTGAATEATLGTIYTRQADGNQKTQVTASALPTGAATETTLGTRLSESTFTTRMPTVGQKTMAASVPVVIASNQNSLDVHLGDNNDAFDRIRVANPKTLFDSKMLYDNLPNIWDDQQTSGSGTTSTYNTNQASVTMAVGNLTAGTRVRQTFLSFPYQPGKSSEIFMTGVLGTPTTGITRRLGYFSGNDGIFFESSPTRVAIVERSFTSGAAVDTAVAQSSWNIDPMNGTGTSGISIDWTKAQIFVIMFQWLGVGAIWYGLDIGGSLYWVHKTAHANVIDKVYMSNPNQPLRYEISNSGTGPAASLVQICCNVAIGGGDDHDDPRVTVYRTTAMQTSNNASFYPVISLKHRSGVNGLSIKVKTLSLTCTSSSTYVWKLVVNPTVVGTALNFQPVVNDHIDADLTSTNATTITGGIDIESGVLTQTADSIVIPISENARLGKSINGTSDVLVLAISRLTGTTETFYAALNFSEI